jgi:mRNA interferase RelE/StbE
LAFKVLWHASAVEDLFHLDRSYARRVVGKVKGHLSKSPQNAGQNLKGQFHGLQRFRVGDYRVIYATDYARKEILILAVNHRKKIYQA